MLRFLISRLVSAVPVLFVVSLVCFLLMWVVPGDVASEIAGADATPQQILQIRANLGLDRPLLKRAVEWYWNLLHGDLGRSYLLNRNVTDAVLERLPVTLSLAGIALILAIGLGIMLGVLAAVNHNNPLDQGALTLALLGLSMPDFWFGLMLIVLFAVHLGWLPTGGFVPMSESLGGWA
ncbi:MAG: ABC transporter permease, partial [Alsobacter sp.]